MGKIITLLIIAGAGYWYWTGPYQSQHAPSYEEQLRINAENMQQCLRTEAYKAGATGEGVAEPEVFCATKLNLYLHDDQWHDYNAVRPDGN